MKPAPKPPKITAGIVPTAIATDSRCDGLEIDRCRTASAKPRVRLTTSCRK
jgi:hypothetical protein